MLAHPGFQGPAHCQQEPALTLPSALYQKESVLARLQNPKTMKNV